MTNIKSQALVGNTGATDDNDRILRYINEAYTKVYAHIAQIYPGLFRRLQNIPITDGVGLYIFPVFKLLSVRDRNNNLAKLTFRSTTDNEECDPGLTATGSPRYYDILFNGLMTYPLNNTVLQIWYTPPPVPLTADTREIDIQIPPMYHYTLEWAALWLMAYDERDKLVGSELKFTDDEFEAHMTPLVMYLFNQMPVEQRRVKLSW